MSGAKAENFDRAAYTKALRTLDAATCEAIAVSQATAMRYVAMNVGYASYVFTRMCGTAVALMRATPLSRWTRSDFVDWHFGSVAPHARALLDGYLLFNYLIEPPESEAELRARMNVMHLNDCTRRIELHANLASYDEVAGFEKQRAELQARLRDNEYFSALPVAVQKQCLNGRFLMIENRDAMLAKVGFEKGHFDALYDLWSQHIHILPISFYRIEPNGRGTGIENDTDRAYLAQALSVSAAVLAEVTDRLIEQFPDASGVRQGVDSKFSPGPDANRPKVTKPRKKSSYDEEGTPTVIESKLALAMKTIFD